MPRPAPKYFGLGPAWIALLGATKRMPSAEATSPLPQMWAIGRAFCAATIRALAAERTTEAGSELFDTRMALADMSEGVGKARAGGDLQHDVRQVDPRHPCRDGGLQGGEAGRPLDLVERAQHQFVTAVPALDPGRWITWEVGSDLAPSAIQSGAEIADLRLGIRRPIEGAADGQACSVPC